MICKDNQKLIDALLRLKSNEDLSINAINQIMEPGYEHEQDCISSSSTRN